MTECFNLATQHQAGLDAATAALDADMLVAVPTETVYGLAADATNAEAVASIFAAKGRPSFNPLIAHVSGLAMAKRYGAFDDISSRLATSFWPGPLTLVVGERADSGIAPTVTAGLGTIALRHPTGIMAELADRLDRPLAAPSANISGTISPTQAAHVASDLGDKIAVILDGGTCPVGLESTIVKNTDDELILLRQGAISARQISEATGRPVANPRDRQVQAPGMLLAHYAPSIPLRMNAIQIYDGEALLAFGKPMKGAPVASRNLSPDGDLDEAAHNLFAMMRELESAGADAIAVQAIPEDGIGIAINDRLRRAAVGGGH